METATGKAPTIGQILAMEMTHEASIARKLVSIAPKDKFEWQPHEKSMTLGRLTNHVVEAFEWTDYTVNNDELDFSTMDYQPEILTDPAEIANKLDRVVKESLDILNSVSDEDIMKPWTMKDGEKIFMTMPKAAVVRSFVLNHMIHHRGQLSVYLRLLDVHLPQIYGPSADEPDM